MGGSVLTQKWHHYSGVSHDNERYPLMLFSGNANPVLASEVSSYLGVPLSDAKVGQFRDGETAVQILEHVRSKKVFIVQPICGNPNSSDAGGGSSSSINENLVELLLMTSALRRASCSQITVVIPYYGYARQSRKMAASVPIASADIAKMLEAMGVDSVVTIDLHRPEIKGFFKVPVLHVSATAIGAAFFAEKELHQPVVVSPKAGGELRAQQFMLNLIEQGYPDTTLAALVKTKVGGVRRDNIVGNIVDRDCILVDDMIDTANTTTKAARLLLQHGARRVFVFATHGIFADKALERIGRSGMEQVVVTNTIAHEPADVKARSKDKVVHLSLAPLIADIISKVRIRDALPNYGNSRSRGDGDDD